MHSSHTTKRCYEVHKTLSIQEVYKTLSIQTPRKKACYSLHVNFWSPKFSTVMFSSFTVLQLPDTQNAITLSQETGNSH
jgi:hypothetical protein